MDQIRDWANWGVDWAWGLPLIVATVVFHAYGLGVIGRMTTVHLAGKGPIRNISAVSVLAMGGTALFATLLHGFESVLWAAAYRMVGAATENRSAMLYSLSAMTTYGHENLRLPAGWQLMGALEALNGWILFGLTTAFLFSVMQKAWPQARAEC